MYTAVVIGLLVIAAIDVTFAVLLYRRGVIREQVRKVQLERQLRQHAGHDLSELGGLSQSSHNGANAA